MSIMQGFAKLTGHEKSGDRYVQYVVDVEGEEFGLTRSDNLRTTLVMTGTLDECEREFLRRCE